MCPDMHEYTNERGETVKEFPPFSLSSLIFRYTVEVLFSPRFSIWILRCEIRYMFAPFFHFIFS